MFAAATVTDSSVRDQLIGLIRSYASASLISMGNFPFPVVYDPTSSKQLVSLDSGTDGGGINRYGTFPPRLICLN